MTDKQTQVTPPAKEQTTLTSPEWPRDIYGITSGLRREIARTVGRLNGDPQKLEVFMGTLKAGAKWAQSRMEVHNAIKARRVENANVLIAAETQQREADDNRTIARGGNETPKQRSDRQSAAGVKGAGINGA